MSDKKFVKFHSTWGAYTAGNIAKFEGHIADSLCGEGGVADPYEPEQETKAPKAREDKALKSPQQASKPSPRDKGERKEPTKVTTK